MGALHTITKQNPVIVVGGGLIGVTTLYELTSRGVPAILLEAGSELAAETSFANGGMMTPSQSEPWNRPGVGAQLFSSLFDEKAAVKLRIGAVPGLAGWGMQFLKNSSSIHYQGNMLANFALASRSAEKTAQLTRQLDLRYAQMSQGSLKIFRDTDAMQHALRDCRKMQRHGLQFEVLDKDALVQKEKMLSAVSENLEGGIYFAADMVADAHLFTLELAKVAISLGGEVHLNAQVSELRMQNGHVTGVQAGHNTFTGPVVMAAGVQSAALVSKAGVSLPVAPVKGYSITIDDLPQDMLPQLPVLDEARHTAIVPIGDTLRIVGTAEFCGYDLQLRSKRLENLQRDFTALYPDLERRLDWSASRPWAGLRPMSAAGRPYIGATGIKGLWINAGHGHLGWTMAAGSAELLVDQMLGADPALAPDAYQIPGAFPGL